ncbi:hypothetical protein J6590_065928 [Homalodisca vitripennis]|nr:hypothetical protein J6590_065928 [Homalodisca vitripennis]
MDSGVQFGEFDRSSLLREMTVGVGGVRSVSIRGSCYPQHKGAPLPVCFDWRGWFRAGFSFPRGHDDPKLFLRQLDWTRPLLQTLPIKISCHSGTKVLIGLGEIL